MQNENEKLTESEEMTPDKETTTKFEDTIRLVRALAYLLYVSREQAEELSNLILSGDSTQTTPRPYDLSADDFLFQWAIEHGRKNLPETIRTLFFLISNAGIESKSMADGLMDKLCEHHEDAASIILHICQTATSPKDFNNQFIENFPEMENDSNYWDESMPGYYIQQNIEDTFAMLPKIAGNSLYTSDTPDSIFMEIPSLFEITLMHAMNEVKIGHFEGHSLADRKFLADLLDVSNQRISQMIQEDKLELDDDGNVTFKSFYKVLKEKATPLLIHDLEMAYGIWWPNTWLPTPEKPWGVSYTEALQAYRTLLGI